MIYHIHKTFKDERGSFTPIKLNTLGEEWTQCSIAVNNSEFTFRGLHYQTNPQQKKYVVVIQGAIIDFSVNIETLQTDWMRVVQDGAVEIPSDRAHGYLTLEPNTIVAYLVQGEYNPESEHSIIWDTVPQVKSVVEELIKENNIIISEKDKLGK